MATTLEIVRQRLEMFGSIPPATHSSVCECCLGPVGAGYERCFACNRLFGYGNAPPSLRGVTVPITSALNPSPWYTWLSTYKRGHPERRVDLASLFYEWYRSNTDNIRQLLGGDPTILTVVPSKKGFTFETQPLRQALALLQPLGNVLRSTLVFRRETVVNRWQYLPSAFAPGPMDVAGHRVLLVEDSWVTGATAVSAAGAILRDNAAAVAIIPLARIVDENFWKSDHPYRLMMKAPIDPWDPARWPR